MDKFTIVLGSKSPRRQKLIKELGFAFEVRTKEIEEKYPSYTPLKEVAAYLATLKASALKSSLISGEILLTSDTVVLNNNEILGKPKNPLEAKNMLRSLSGGTHEVITGVHLQSLDKTHTFSVGTIVHFAKLTDVEIDFYINKYKPFDKAGAYGIQEWIGYIGVEKIEGCYYNVMGLPVHEVYKQLMQF